MSLSGYRQDRRGIEESKNRGIEGAKAGNPLFLSSSILESTAKSPID